MSEAVGRVGGRINLGIFAVFFGISLILACRGGKNDTYTALLVFMIALFQLFEFGVWKNLDCNPGESNDKASHGAYILIWAMPAVLCLAGAFLAGNVIAVPASKQVLLGAGLVFAAFALSILPILWSDKRTWCSQPGNVLQPIWWFQKEEVPLQLNLLWLVGILMPTVLVDPAFLGSGTLAIGVGSYMFGRTADELRTGEWLSVTALMSNGIGIWALFYPVIRYMMYGLEVAL